ncbi:2-dehydro-3-deoxygalactonokinase [Loktanella sp. SALINAS62]|uniref:2-dehydro-3-deoxygalactonokinase n=1 Tax=Loktanella sp. SALINAS62 TaxID=2706124 RepID=UPI001B8AD1A8|nr:2-dehydro-3-deoxygalactonokinase [Loktanella sp. SALINAS62]MBS1304302.1 2-dehydro-3-deoxygalactonokinase [Loktanella sp. SALINAS62]
MTVSCTWIAVDWGTTHLRAWAMSASGSILAEASSADGMGTLDRAGFGPALDRLCADWDTVPVIACGMVGSRQGWAEAPYATVPCAPLTGPFATVSSDRFTVQIIPGLKQPTPADVMRGEETQIAGFLAQNPNWDGVICLPGTHTKWVHISADEVVSFQTCMTGDLFAAISGHTVLRHSCAEGWDDAGFAQGLDDALSRPERLAARLFSLRAESLLHDLQQPQARARLSGLLIGAELAATKPYWLGQQVAVIGAGGLAHLYVTALATQGVSATQVNAERTTLAGLTAAYHLWKDTL